MIPIFSKSFLKRKKLQRLIRHSSLMKSLDLIVSLIRLFALPYIGCCHKGCDFFTVHQVFNYLKLLFSSCGHLIIPCFRKYRQIGIPPFRILLIIILWLCQLHKMSHAPTDKITISLQIAIFSIRCTQYLCQTLCH